MRELNNITYAIRGAAFEVQTALGPGLLESAYEACLSYELVQRGLSVKKQQGIPLIYKEVNLPIGYRADLIVNDNVIIELKSVRELAPIDTAQLLTYMRLSNIKLGLLMNFNVSHMKDSIKRYIF